MSKKVGAVEEPEIVDEESDDYDDIEDEEDEDAGAVEDEDDAADEEGLAQRGSSLTALLVGGSVEDAEEEGDEDDEYEDDDDDDDEEYAPVDIKGPATEAIQSAPPPPVGTKRTREADGSEDLPGDHEEVNENGENVKKKAKAAAEEEI